MTFGVQDLIQLLGGLCSSEHSYFFQLLLLFRKQKKFPCQFVFRGCVVSGMHTWSFSLYQKGPSLLPVPSKGCNIYLFSVVVCGDENISDTVKHPVAEGLLYL